MQLRSTESCNDDKAPTNITTRNILDKMQGWAPRQHVGGQGHWSLRSRPVIKNKFKFKYNSAYFNCHYFLFSRSRSVLEDPCKSVKRRA